MTEHTSTGPAGDESTNDPAPPTDPKERFRQALEAKNKAAHRTSDGVRADGSVHGSEVTGGGKRTFRRKTG